jgi:hypothetical protein
VPSFRSTGLNAPSFPATSNVLVRTVGLRLLMARQNYNRNAGASQARESEVCGPRRLAIIMHAMLRDGTEFASAKPPHHETGGPI